LSLVVGAVFIVALLHQNVNRFTTTLFFTDAIGLGMFTVAGIERSLAHGINDVYAMIMGVMSATFGGLLGDILSNRVPALLTRGELYATACAIGGVFYILMMKAGLNDTANLIISVSIVVAVRIISKKKNVALPRI
jgi:uncharacterized membrane protein YeiH